LISTNYFTGITDSILQFSLIYAKQTLYPPIWMLKTSENADSMSCFYETGKHIALFGPKKMIIGTIYSRNKQVIRLILGS